MENQPTNEEGINVLEELERLVLLRAEEHGVDMAEHSQALMEHIKWTLTAVGQATNEEE